MIQRGAFTGGEAFLAALAFELEDIAIFATVTIMDEGVDSRIGNAKVVTQGIQAGKSAGVGLLLHTPFTFPVCPRCHLMVDASHLQLDSRATVGAICWCFGVPVPKSAILLSLPQASNRFADGVKLATTDFAEQKPQPDKDDKLLKELYIKEVHGCLRE